MKGTHIAAMLLPYEALFTEGGGADLFVRPTLTRRAWFEALSNVGVAPRGVEIIDVGGPRTYTVPLEELEVFVELRTVDEGGDFTQHARVCWHGSHSLGLGLVRALVATQHVVVCIPSGERDYVRDEDALVAFPSASASGSGARLSHVVDDGTVTWGVAVVRESDERIEVRLVV